MSGYKDLEIWKLSREIVIEIHNITMNMLPKFEMYEVGSQIRRSSKSVKACIVEGYGRRHYKSDFLKFLHYSLASNMETEDHLDTLFVTKSFTDAKTHKILTDKIDTLGKKIRNMISSVEKQHLTDI